MKSLTWILFLLLFFISSTCYSAPVREVEFKDGGSIDAFHRQRVSMPVDIFNNKNLFSKNDSFWAETTTGTGASITYLSDEVSVKLEVGTSTGAKALRQSLLYIPYLPGKSQYISMTGILGDPKENVVRRIGYFDDENGLFFESDSSNINVVLRSKSTGSIVETRVPQSQWNINTMLAEPNLLDATKSQIFVIDFQWLGVGRVRYGFYIRGKIVYVHEFRNANSQTEAYMATPSLPVRYEIFNEGTSTSTTSMKEICVSVASEGGFVFPGLEFSASNDITLRTATSTTTPNPVFAIRLKNSFKGKPNRRAVKILLSNFLTITNASIYEIKHIHDPFGISATWSSADDDSAVEFSVDITAISGVSEHLIQTIYTAPGQANNGSDTTLPQEFINKHNILTQNKDSDNSQVFVVFAKGVTGSSSVGVSLTWMEYQ